jgi:hypothetical protein
MGVKLDLSLWEEQRLRVSENRVLRRTTGPKREEVAGGWVRLHILLLHNLYASVNIIWMIKSRKMRWLGHVTYVREMRNVCKILV